MAVTTHISGTDRCYGVATQPDGKLVLVGTEEDFGTFAVVRYSSNGVLDTSFGTGGIVTTSIFPAEESDVARAVAIQSDGKIVVAGYGYDGARDVWIVCRYNSDGSLDSGFGTSGVTTISFGTSTTNARCYAVAIQSDGKIVLGGKSWNTSDFTFARLTTTGALDTGFASGGKGFISTHVHGDTATSIAIQSDGKIILAGPSYQDWAVVRLTTSGAADSTFGSSGIAYFEVGSGDNYGSGLFCALQSDGKVILAGYLSSSSSMGIARLTTSGGLDTSFGASGFTSISGGLRSSAITIIGSDSILVAGGSGYSSNIMRVVKLTSSGSLDTSFGASGVADIAVTNPGFLTDAGGIIVQPSGKIVLVGTIDATETTDTGYDFGLLRLNTDGTEDTSFGADTGIDFSIDATTANATCAAVFLVPSELTISATTADATCTAVFSIDPILSIAASTAAATCAAVFLVPSDLTISATTQDATCAASFFVGANVFSVDITTDNATCAAVFDAPPCLTISATTADATCVASFRAGNGLTISAITDDATCAAVFDAPPRLTISATTADATCVASFRAGNSLIISATTADATCAASFSATAGMVINARTEDATCVASFYLTPQLTIIAQLEDAVSTGGATATYVYSPDHDSFTEYSGFWFNSYARIGGNYFAAGNNGLYQLGGDDDAGVDIQAYILTGMLDFGGHMMSRTPRMYFDFSGDSGLAVSVYTSTDGLRRTEAFTLSLPAAPVDRSACLPLGRGLPSHFWQYRVSNVTGGSLEFTRCAPHVIPLSRSV